MTEIEDETTKLKAQLAGIYDQINTKRLELRTVNEELDRAVGPILDAPSPKIRAQLAEQRRQKLDEAELLRAEIELLNYRVAACESALRRLGETIFIPAPVRLEPLRPEHR